MSIPLALLFWLICTNRSPRYINETTLLFLTALKSKSKMQTYSTNSLAPTLKCETYFLLIPNSKISFNLYSWTSGVYSLYKVSILATISLAWCTVIYLPFGYIGGIFESFSWIIYSGGKSCSINLIYSSKCLKRAIFSIERLNLFFIHL